MNIPSADLAHPRPSAGRSLAALAGWLLLTFSASATAVFVSTGGWYAGLAKPAWNPPGWALAEILVLLLAILATMRAFWRVDQPAGLLLLPYTAWVAFATVLNWAIWRMN